MSVRSKQKALIEVLQKASAPMSFQHLAELMQVSEKEQKRELTKALNALIDAGELLQNRAGHYGIAAEMDLMPGTVLAHADGFGFLKTDEPGPDWFLPPREMEAVFPGDRVLVREGRSGWRGKTTAQIVDVLERKTTSLVGTVHIEAGYSYLIPHNPRNCHQLIIPTQARGGAAHGDLVRARVTQQPQRHVQPVCEVEAILGEEINRQMRIDIAISDFSLPREFDPGSQEDLQTALNRPISATEERRDCRHLGFVTIDGADARDFDDAVYVRPTAKGWKLYVAIADVSYYVRPETLLDEDAYARATSVYFPGQVVPMLPPELSDGLCSLRPNEDRNAMVCELQVSQSGAIQSSRFYAAVIRSQARLIYEDVAEALAQGDHPQLADLQNLHALYKALAAARTERGCLDFEGQEVRFVWDEQDRVKGIEPVSRNTAHRMIEECMIAANVAAARFLRRHDAWALNRVHELPQAEAVKDLRAFAAEWGLSMPKGERIHTAHYADVLQAAKDLPIFKPLQLVVLRSMQQAVYSPERSGHFGLALKDYAHFTSPIRRYPDLLVHRAIKAALGISDGSAQAQDYETMLKAGQHCSAQERNADSASWSVIDALKCDYLADKIGLESEGEISGVTNFGLFVDLPDVHVSGLVHISRLGADYFHHEPVKHRLRGERSGICFRLGDKMKVRLSRVDAQERKIDFEPLAHCSSEDTEAGENSVWREL